MKNITLLLSFLLLTQLNLLAQNCDDSQEQVIIHVLSDNYPGETNYTLQGADGVEYLNFSPTENLTLYSDTLCVPAGLCLTFRITDTYGDGICCGFGDGYYQVFLEGELVVEGGDFSSLAQHNFNCGPGSNCENALEVTQGSYETEIPYNSQWHVFTTTETGMYTISTCDDLNACNTTIWVYDYCDFLIWDNSNEATYAFNEDFCDTLAEVSIALGANEIYYIRIGSAAEDCNNQLVNWSISYDGPISGCMDPQACNFNPLASIDDGTCSYPGDPECPTGPDLLVRQDVFQSSLSIDYINNTDGCLIEEACVSGYGQRELLRFTTHIDNIGESDYYIGVPEEGNAQFEFDACHNHWHYEGYAEYLVFDSNGQALPNGFKNGFCVLDLTCDWGTAQYGCGNMGISAGCGDIYGSGLSCQWFDITNLEPGDYTFAIAVNWDNDPDALGQYEVTYENNWAQVCLRIERDPISFEASYEVLEDCQPYVDCAGVQYGNAISDCNGDCNGTALQGDITANGTRDTEDINMYLQESLNNATGTTCTDLNADGQISVTDMILALECTQHEGMPAAPGHDHNPCDFPFSITNPQHVVLFGIGEVNMDEGWFEVTLQNPFNKIAGFEFSIEGATISSVETMLLDWNHDLHFSDTEIIGFSWQEEILEKSEELRILAKVYYSELTADEICIGEITASVNDAHEETSTVATTCASVFVSNTNTINTNDYNAFAFPNPTKAAFTLVFDSAIGESANVVIIDMTGKTVYSKENVLGSSLEINHLQLAAGVYTYKVEGNRGRSVGKISVQ